MSSGNNKPQFGTIFKIALLVIFIVGSLGGLSYLVYFLVNSNNGGPSVTTPPYTTTPPTTTIPPPTTTPPTTTPGGESDVVLPSERTPRDGLTVARYNYEASEPTFTIQETAGTDWSDLPVSIGYIFREGDFSDGIAIETLSGTSISSAMTVLRQWADGSIKHALFSFYIDSITAYEEITYRFVPSSASSTSGISITNILDTTFDVSVSFTDLDYSLSARELLEEASVLELWQDNMLCTEFLLEGHPLDASDVEHDNLWVQFQVRFYPLHSAAKINVIVENCFVEVSPDYEYDVVITTGISEEVVFSQNDVYHYANSRWREIIWWGEETIYYEPNIIVNPDYFISTGCLT